MHKSKDVEHSKEVSCLNVPLRLLIRNDASLTATFSPFFTTTVESNGPHLGCLSIAYPVWAALSGSSRFSALLYAKSYRSPLFPLYHPLTAR